MIYQCEAVAAPVMPAAETTLLATMKEVVRDPG